MGIWGEERPGRRRVGHLGSSLSCIPGADVLGVGGQPSPPQWLEWCSGRRCEDADSSPEGQTSASRTLSQGKQERTQPRGSAGKVSSVRGLGRPIPHALCQKQSDRPGGETGTSPMPAQSDCFSPPGQWQYCRETDRAEMLPEQGKAREVSWAPTGPEGGLAEGPQPASGITGTARAHFCLTWILPSPCVARILYHTLWGQRGPTLLSVPPLELNRLVFLRCFPVIQVVMSVTHL